MKTHPPIVPALRASLCAALWAPFANSGLAASRGTAFTFQGKLTDGGPSANGSYDLKFTLYDVARGGSPVAALATNSYKWIQSYGGVLTLNPLGNTWGGPRRIEP